MSSFAEIDPVWAWSPFEPDGEQVWDRALAAHLYRRAGFAATMEELDAAVKMGPDACVEHLLRPTGQALAFEQQADALAETILAGGDPKQLAAAWTYRLLHTPFPLLEKTTLFWHGHFATGADKVADADMMWAQNRLLRKLALGDFEQLVQGISRDPAMLVYLDSVTNRKAHPNENYARELMELFCLGEGNYSERDVQELARCFTGWEIKNRRFRKNRYQHDNGSKMVLGQSGNFDGEEAVRVVLQQPAMPRFIVRKLIHFFVFDEPLAPTPLVDVLAKDFRDNGLQVGPVIAKILRSNLFYSKYAVARKIRSPIELAIGLLRALAGSTNVVELADQLTQVGQGLFYPPNVKGWDGGRTWINSSTLLGRANLVRRVLEHEKTRFDNGRLDQLMDSHGLQQPRDMVAWLSELLFAVPLPDDVAARLVALAADASKPEEARIKQLVHAMCTLPEFQLG